VHELTIRETDSTGEVHNRRKNGEEFISYLSASVLRDNGRPDGLMGISYDVTEQKKLKERHEPSNECARNSSPSPAMT